VSATSTVLVLNTGSSSIKYQLFDLDAEGAGQVQAAGLVEGVGEPASALTHRVPGTDPLRTDDPIPDHEAGFAAIRTAFEKTGGLPSELAGIGHRVVHGGERFSAPAVIDDGVVTAIEEQVPLAPLHNPSNLVGIRIARQLYPAVPQVAVFDTAFHATMPPRAFRYALPPDVAGPAGIRRYGFHGTSHAYVAQRAAEFLGREPADLNLITLHLGNGASVAAIAGGVCIDTSMGMTPLEGLVMGTRCGDLDPAVPLYLQRRLGLTAEQADTLLNRGSGLKGLTGSNDVREIQRRSDAGDAVAAEALDIFCYRIRKYLGAYAFALGRLDAVVFTAGIGENAPAIRAAVCAGLGGFGIAVDAGRNIAPDRRARAVSPDGAGVAVLVVPTDEELQIARQTLARV
jgi:acetate kinase